MDDTYSYIAIDLKSFYSSVECIERGLDPLTTNLVVADERRSEKTICLAVSSSLKSYGISGRPRLFEVVQQIKAVNSKRKWQAPNKTFTGESYDQTVLRASPDMAVDYLVAIPRMALYIEYSTHIYEIYLKYIAPEDIHVYSIDEVFINAAPYMKLYQMTAHELAMMMIREVFQQTGITATAGIGTNLYLCKIAMDIVAKKMPADENGVRIAQLDEMSYRHELWNHQPLTDFWRVGKGYAKKLQENGLFTMGDIARCSLHNEDKLYQLFGINAELLIDHAWGWEPCTMADIKAYKPENNSLSAGQVLSEAYSFDKARLVVREMVELLALDLVEKKLVTDQIVLTIGYDRLNLSAPSGKNYHGEVTTDHYGRQILKHAHGTANLKCHTSSARLMIEAVLTLFDKIVDSHLSVRRINIAANHVVSEESITQTTTERYEQLDLFTDYAALEEKQKAEQAALEKERQQQNAVIAIRQKYGKNAIIKGMSLEDGATTREVNKRIGGHNA